MFFAGQLYFVFKLGCLPHIYYLKWHHYCFNINYFFFLYMKILHTADWHLGKKLDNFSRHSEQIAVLHEITQIADREAVDIVIIAGDLYDSINPPLESQSLFYNTLKKLAKDGERPIIAIAGNHDSPERIDSPDPLAKECGIIFIGKPKAVVAPFELKNKFAITQSEPGFFELNLPNKPPIRIIHTAFANESRLKTYFGQDKAAALNDLLAAHWQELSDKYCDNQGINILTTHLYMQRLNEPLEEPEGEKPLKIGNADVVYTHAIPTAVQYTALGHLHRYQNIGNSEKPIVYASAPIAYSFSEANQEKHVVIVNASPTLPVSISPIALKQGKKLFKKTFDDIDTCAEWLQNNPNCLVELTIKTQHFLTPSDTKKLYQIHDGIVYIIPKPQTKNETQSATKPALDLSKSVIGLFEDYYKHRNNGVAPSKDLMEIFKEFIN